jgi:hypothetical protein
VGKHLSSLEKGIEMSKRLAFTSVNQIQAYTQARFSSDVAFSRMSAAEKAYANVYNMTRLNPSLSQLKRDLEASRKTALATREKIYQFFIERIVEVEDPQTTLAAVKQELTHILGELQVMKPLLPADSSMDDVEHEAWTRQHTDIGLLLDQSRNVALWLVPEEVKLLLRNIDKQCILLYSAGDAELSQEESALYNVAKAEEGKYIVGHQGDVYPDSESGE